MFMVGGNFQVEWTKPSCWIMIGTNLAHNEDGPGGNNNVILAKQIIMTKQQSLLTHTNHLLCSLFYCCGAKDNSKTIFENSTENLSSAKKVKMALPLTCKISMIKHNNL